MPELAFYNTKSGTECYAWQYDWPDGLNKPMLTMKPVRGILAEYPDRIGDTARGPGWFVPYAKRSRHPAFTKAARVESVKLCTDMIEAEDAYNKAVRAVAARYFSMAAMVQEDIIRTKRDGFVNDTLENYPVMRPDMSLDYTGIAAAAEPDLELLPDYEGSIMNWENFNGLMDQGTINVYDGVATFRLDGKGCSNAVIDMWSGLIYIADKYAVPFRMVPSVFAAHKPEVHWFPK